MIVKEAIFLDAIKSLQIAAKCHFQRYAKEKLKKT